jgi:hypothetical protein
LQSAAFRRPQSCHRVPRRHPQGAPARDRVGECGRPPTGGPVRSDSGKNTSPYSAPSASESSAHTEPPPEGSCGLAGRVAHDRTRVGHPPRVGRAGPGSTRCRVPPVPRTAEHVPRRHSGPYKTQAAPARSCVTARQHIHCDVSGRINRTPSASSGVLTFTHN